MKNGDVKWKDMDELFKEIGGAGSEPEPESKPEPTAAAHPSRDFEIRKLLSQQLSLELHASYGYQRLATWCRSNTLDGFAAMFKAQADEEMDHAWRVINFLVDVDEEPIFTDLTCRNEPIKSIEHALELALKGEMALTKYVSAMHQTAFIAGEVRVVKLMDWFVNEQVEEEAKFRRYLKRVKADNSAAAIFEMDKQLEEAWQSIALVSPQE